LRIVFMRAGVAEEHDQTVTEVLSDVSVEARDHLAAGVVVRPHDFAELFGVELTGQWRRVG
jgi:hypothetical protein